MKPKYRQFIFESYEFHADAKKLELHYSYDTLLHFTESFTFDFEFIQFDAEQLDRACQHLFFMAGVSYYKAYIAPEIIIRSGHLDAESALFFNKTYQRGLGEFFYRNRLDPKTAITFPEHMGSAATNESKWPVGNGVLIGIGGGKDSLVSVELLRKTVPGIATFSVNHRPQLTPQVERIDLPHYWVERTIDPTLIEHNGKDALNGHIPISAILACVGVITAILAGKRDVVVSNEQSANEPTLVYDGTPINHQYSKSQEFERDYQSLLAHTFGDTVRYYSLLRPFSELRIAEMFARIGFDKYRDVFSSCNRAFVLGRQHLFWDGTCPKCAFVYLVLTPFIPKQKLEQIFDGKNLLLDAELEETYRQLLGIEGDKPLECIGEVKESRAAMRLAEKVYPDLKNIYHFSLPEDYDHASLSTDEMPDDVRDIVIASAQDPFKVS